MKIIFILSVFKNIRMQSLLTIWLQILPLNLDINSKLNNPNDITKTTVFVPKKKSQSASTQSPQNQGK